MTPTHLPIELVPCTCNHQRVQAIPITTGLSTPASVNGHFSDQAECARAGPLGGTSKATSPVERSALGQGLPVLLPDSPAQFSAARVCPMMVGLPRLNGRPGLQAPILEGCHPSLMSLWSKGPEGGPGEPGLAGILILSLEGELSQPWA